MLLRATLITDFFEVLEMKQLNICFIGILSLDLCLTSHSRVAPWLACFSKPSFYNLLSKQGVT